MLTSTTLNGRRKQRGITLIEVSIGLIIAAIIAAAAFIAFQNNSRRTEIRENASNIAEIASEVRTKFIRTNRVGELTGTGAVAALQAANIFDPIGGQAVNSYGGTVSFAVTNGVVTMSWDDVDNDQCVDLVSTVLSGGFSEVTIGAAVLNPASPLAGTGSITAACATGDADIDIVI